MLTLQLEALNYCEVKIWLSKGNLVALQHTRDIFAEIEILKLRAEKQEHNLNYTRSKLSNSDFLT